MTEQLGTLINVDLRLGDCIDYGKGSHYLGVSATAGRRRAYIPGEAPHLDVGYRSGVEVFIIREVVRAGDERREEEHTFTKPSVTSVRSIEDRIGLTQQAIDSTTILLSQVQDVDFAEAVTKFQQTQTALQASLLASGQSLNLSLLNFLR